MFIFLSKLIPPFIYPLGLGCFLVLLALFLRRKPRLQRSALILALVLVWGGSTRFAAFSLARSLEWRYRTPPELANRVPGAAPVTTIMVLLGGGTEPQEYPRPTVELDNSRVIYAAYLYKQGVSKYILLSGGTIDFLGGSGSPAAEMQTLLELMGVPAEALWLEDTSRNTYENAVNSRQMIEARVLAAGEQKQRIVLVTSAMHMPRSVALYQHQGFQVIPAPTDYTVTQLSWNQLWEFNLTTQIFNLMPTASNLATTTNAIKEYLGILVYWLRGWL